MCRWCKSHLLIIPVSKSHLEMNPHQLISPQLQTGHIFPSSGAGKSLRDTEQAAPSAASNASKESAPGSATSGPSNFLSGLHRIQAGITSQHRDLKVRYQHVGETLDICFCLGVNQFGGLTSLRNPELGKPTLCTRDWKKFVVSSSCYGCRDGQSGGSN